MLSVSTPSIPLVPLLQSNDSTVQVEEIAGAVQLLLRRGPGQFGQVSVMWRAVGVTALGGGVDFEPESGIVTFQDLQVLFVVL